MNASGATSQALPIALGRALIVGITGVILAAYVIAHSGARVAFVGTPEHAERLSELRRLLWAWSVATEDHRPIVLPEPVVRLPHRQGSTA